MAQVQDADAGSAGAGDFTQQLTGAVDGLGAGANFPRQGSVSCFMAQSISVIGWKVQITY
jgi:hypothetical protein